MCLDNRHLPDGNYDVYDFSYTGLAANNRWNTQGEQTLYLADSVDVAAGEWSRHYGAYKLANLRRQTAPLQFDRPKQLAAKTKCRKVDQMKVKLNHTLNLCDRLCWQELSLKDAPNCFLDKKIALGYCPVYSTNDNSRSNFCAINGISRPNG